MNLDLAQSWLDRNRLGVVLALVGLILLGAGWFWLKTGFKSENKVEILSASTEQKTTKTIYIDISGAVNAPGVYQLEPGSRVDDAIKKAGGLATDANFKWIETNLNRASVLSDGAKLYIPSQSEVQVTNAGASGSLVKTSNEKININSATQSELEALAGIGPVTAGKIINGRPYQNVEELVTKKIVGQKVFDNIKNQLSVW